MDTYYRESPVNIRTEVEGWTDETYPIELRIGATDSKRSSAAVLTPWQARQIAHLLIAAMEEGERG